MNEASFFCIYRGQVEPESSRSLEHVVPYALGGTGEFATRDVSGKANGDIGTFVDGPLINHPLITMERWRLQIRGQSGSIPGIEFRGTVEVNGVPVDARYLIQPDGSVELNTLPSVDSDWAKGVFRINCNPADLQRILEDIEKKGTKKGLPVGPEGIRVESLKHTRIEQPTLSTAMSIGLVDFVPGFVKMALGSGHFVFGPAWSRSPDADLLRAFINERDPKNLSNIPIHGSVWPNTAADDIIKKNCFIDNDKHVILVLNQKPAAFYALLFGRFDGFVQLAEQPIRCEELQVGKGVVFVICCKTRQVMRVDWEQFIMNQMIEKGWI